MEGARIYGQNVIREKNQALNFLRLSSRVDAVAARLETAIRMQQVEYLFSTILTPMLLGEQGNGPNSERNVQCNESYGP
jgi:charged multivesicular body protein 1